MSRTLRGDQMRRIISNNWVKIIIIIILSSIISMLLMYLVYLIPTDRMAINVAASKETLLSQDDDTTQKTTGYFDYYDTGTNIIMLHEVIYPNTGNALRDSLLVPAADYYVGNLNTWIDNLYDKATNRTYSDNDFVTYARYWHGYLILLKPLFLLFNLNTIYWINTIVLIVLTLITAYYIYKRLGSYVVAFIAMIALMNPTHIVRSFQLSAVYIAMIITTLIIVTHYDEHRKKDIILYFAIDGCIVALFDFLTYPLVAFAVPLMTHMIMEGEDSLLRRIITSVKDGIAFVLGYGGLWLLKWIGASLLTDENVILDGVYNTLHRVGMAEMSEDVLYDDSPLMSLKINASTIINYQTIIILAVTLLIIAVIIIINRGKLHVDKNIMIMGIIIAILPVIWYIVVHNHCALHPHLEWREWVISFYALFVILISFKGKRHER